jgi:phosphotransferase system enzyme I (PtsI)
VRGLNVDDCVRFARRVMEQSDPAKIQEMLMGASGAPAPA